MFLSLEIWHTFWERINLHQNFISFDIVLKLTTGVWRVLNIFNCRMPLTILSNQEIKFQPHILRMLELFHWNIIQEKQLQRPFNSTETHWNSSNLDIFYVFILFYGSLNIFFFFIVESFVVSRYIGLINFLSILCFYYI